MNLSDYTFLLNRPDAVNDQKAEALERIVTEFPYFQSARALRLKGLYNQNSFQYNYALKITAAYTTDRSVLFDFITSDTFTTIQKGLYQQKLQELNNIDVTASVEVTKADPTEDKVESSILSSIREAENANAIQVVSEEVVSPEPVMEAETDQPEIATKPEVDFEVPAVEFVPVDTPMISTETNEEVQSEAASEKLEIGRPLEFSRDERHSFAEWLQLSSFKPIVREEKPTGIEGTKEEVTESAKAEEKPSKLELIDRFIEANPKIPPIKQDSVTPIPEPREDSSIMTETLARVYLEQKKYQKAIQAYEILILKYPEKSIFFADRISEIKKLQ